MRAAAILALQLASFASARAECLIHSVATVPITVETTSGERFDVTLYWPSLTVHYRAIGGANAVDVSSPIAFHGTLGAAEVTLAKGEIYAQGAIRFRDRSRVRPVAIAGDSLVVDLTMGGVAGTRATIPCEWLAVAEKQRDPAPLPVARHFRPVGGALHISPLPSATPVVLRVIDRQHLDLSVSGHDEKSIRVAASFEDGSIDGWVPVADVERLAGDDPPTTTRELVLNRPVGPCHTYPDGRLVSIPAGTVVLARPGKDPWAIVSHELETVVLADAGPWLRIALLGPNAWVRRSALGVPKK